MKMLGSKVTGSKCVGSKLYLFLLKKYTFDPAHFDPRYNFDPAHLLLVLCTRGLIFCLHVRFSPTSRYKHSVFQVWDCMTGQICNFFSEKKLEISIFQIKDWFFACKLVLYRHDDIFIQIFNLKTVHQNIFKLLCGLRKRKFALTSNLEIGGNLVLVSSWMWKPRFHAKYHYLKN